MKTSFEKFMASNVVNQVELSEVKVDLSSMDDLKAIWAEGEKKWQSVRKVLNELDTIQSDWNKSIAMLSTQLAEVEAIKSRGIKKSDEIDTQLKGLGLEASSDVNNMRTIFKMYANTTTTIQDRVKSGLASMKKL